MFKTLEGAKSRAKGLHSQLKGSGFLFPLQKCQAAIARAGGYQDWHHLQATLRKGPLAQAMEAPHFIRNLLRQVPPPCRPVISRWLDGSGDNHPPGSRLRYFQDIFPYAFAIGILHRKHTSLFRPGSGPGMKLRESLVLGLIANYQGGHAVLPDLDPETLVLTFSGTLMDVFRMDIEHPRFDTELVRLVQEGLIEVDFDRPWVKIHPPEPKLVLEYVLDDSIGKAEQWADLNDKAASDALANVLSMLGIAGSARIADAIMSQGSAAYITDSGPALELLSDLAEEGDLDTMSQLYGAFSVIYPNHARLVRNSIPAKISSRYIARNRGLGLRQFNAYAERHPEWADTLKSSLHQPVRFRETVIGMAAAIAAI